MNLVPVKYLKRGRGASGFIQAEVIGKPVLSEDGVCTDVDFSELTAKDSDILSLMKEKGLDTVSVLADALNRALRDLAEGSNSTPMILRRKIVAAGLLDGIEDEKMRESKLTAFVSSVFSLSKALGKSYDEAIELIVVAKS